MIQKYPDSDIKFMAIDEIGILNIFLNDERAIGPHIVFNSSLDDDGIFLVGEFIKEMFFEFEKIKQTFDRIEQMNISPLVHIGWLHDPRIW